VLEKPEAPSSPIRPRKKLNIAVAMVLGLGMGIFVALITNYFKSYPLNLRRND